MLFARAKLPKTRQLLMQFAHAARVTRRWHTEQCVTMRSEPVIEDWAQFCEWPYRHYRREPSPTREDANHFDPRKVAFSPQTRRRSDVHLFSHLFARVGCRAREDCRIVVVKPLQAMIAIKRLNLCARPATEVAPTVGVDFNSGGIHCLV